MSGGVSTGDNANRLHIRILAGGTVGYHLDTTWISPDIVSFVYITCACNNHVCT